MCCFIECDDSGSGAPVLSTVSLCEGVSKGSPSMPMENRLHVRYVLLEVCHAEVAINNRKSLRTGPYITGDEPIGASIPYPEMVWLWICFSTWRMGISLSVKTYTINAVKTCRTCHLATVRWPSPLRWCSCRSQELQTISMTWATLRAADGMKAMLGCYSFAMITGVFMLSSSLLGICC